MSFKPRLLTGVIVSILLAAVLPIVRRQPLPLTSALDRAARQPGAANYARLAANPAFR